MAAQVWQGITYSGRPVPRSVQTVNAAPGDTPGLVTGSADGLLLVDVGAYAVFALADNTFTISTAVNAIAYTQDPYSGLWGRASDFDITGQTVTGFRQVQIGGFQVTAPAGRVVYANNGGAVSGGGHLNFRLIATRTRINGGLM